MLAYNISKSKLPRLKVKSIGEPSVKSSDYAFTPKGILEWKKAIKLKQKRKTKRKFSRKQLAAQRLFAKRARAGTLRRRKTWIRITK